MRFGRLGFSVALACLAFCTATAAAAEERLVVIVPMGSVDDRAVKIVSDALAATGDVRLRIDDRRPLPRSAYYAPRRRYRAERILAAVTATPPERAWKIVVVTDAEISTTKGDGRDWGIGGFSWIGGRACVVSTFLLRKHGRDPKLFEDRLRKLSIHEFGHVLGLGHCGVFACPMRDAKGKILQMLDASVDRWCGRCRRLLADEG